MAVATQQLPTGTWQLDPVHSSAGFAVKHMGVSTFRGRFEHFDATLTVGDDGEARLAGTVRPDSIVVKNEDLEAHLQSPEFFDAERYPEFRFESSAIRVEGDALVIEGELTIKDATVPVRGRGSFTGPREDIAGFTRLGVALEANVDRTQFGMNWNADLPSGGVALENDVAIQVELEFTRS